MPGLVIGGASPIALRGRMVMQELDGVKLLEPVTRWASTSDDAKRIPEFVSSAFRYMPNGRNRPGVLIDAAGSFGFNAMEFDTALRHNLPFVCVIANDGKWGMVRCD